MAEHNKLIADLALGVHDNQLIDILEVIKKRLTAGVVQVRWRITHDECSFTEDSVTLGEIRAVERYTGLDWFAINPRSSAEQMVALLAAHNAKVHQMPADEAMAAAEAIPLGEIASLLSEYQVDPKGDSPE